MEIRIKYLFRDAASTELDSVITDGALIPALGDYVVLNSGSWKVYARYYDLNAATPTVQLILTSDSQL